EDLELVPHDTVWRRLQPLQGLPPSHQLREVELALTGRQLALAVFLDAIRKLRRHPLLQAPHHDRPQSRREQSPHVRGSAGPIVTCGESRPATEIAGIDELHDAPQIERA